MFVGSEGQLPLTLNLQPSRSQLEEPFRFVWEEGFSKQRRESAAMATDGAPCAKKARPGGLDAVVSSFALPALGDAMWLAVDPCDGISFFVCTHYAIMTVSPTGVISLLAGGKQGFVDGQGRDARFNIPRGIAVDKDGNLLVADCNNHAIRKVTRTGLVTTVAGNGQAGFADGLGAAATARRALQTAWAPQHASRTPLAWRSTATACCSCQTLTTTPSARSRRAGR